MQCTVQLTITVVGICFRYCSRQQQQLCDRPLEIANKGPRHCGATRPRNALFTVTMALLLAPQRSGEPTQAHSIINDAQSAAARCSNNMPPDAWWVQLLVFDRPAAPPRRGGTGGMLVERRRNSGLVERWRTDGAPAQPCGRLVH